jgi:hypothetical protein
MGKVRKTRTPAPSEEEAEIAGAVYDADGRLVSFTPPPEWEVEVPPWPTDGQRKRFDRSQNTVRVVSVQPKSSNRSPPSIRSERRLSPVSPETTNPPPNDSPSHRGPQMERALRVLPKILTEVPPRTSVTTIHGLVASELQLESERLKLERERRGLPVPTLPAAPSWQVVARALDSLGWR